MAELTKYQRSLLNRLEAGTTSFITLRLADSLPRTVVTQMRAHLHQLKTAEQRLGPAELARRRSRYFRHLDDMLDQVITGPSWLSRPEVAGAVQAGFHQPDGQDYELICYCIMPNHAHLIVFRPADAPLLAQTLQRLKSHTAAKANQQLRREGAFWHPDSYELEVRDGEELQQALAYVLENPVKAGLVTEWQKWPHSYWRDQ